MCVCVCGWGRHRGKKELSRSFSACFHPCRPRLSVPLSHVPAPTHRLPRTGSCAQVIGYTQLSPRTAWWLLALEPLHGITFGLAWVAAVDKIEAEVPREWRTSGQLLLNTCMWSVGRTAGAIFGGQFYHHGAIFGLRGGRALYAVAAFGAVAVLATHTAATCLLRGCGYRGLHTPPPPPTVVEPLPALEGSPPGRLVFDASLPNARVPEMQADSPRSPGP